MVDTSGLIEAMIDTTIVRNSAKYRNNRTTRTILTSLKIRTMRINVMGTGKDDPGFPMLAAANISSNHCIETTTKSRMFHPRLGIVKNLLPKAKSRSTSSVVKKKREDFLRPLIRAWGQFLQVPCAIVGLHADGRRVRHDEDDREVIKQLVAHELQDARPARAEAMTEDPAMCSRSAD
mmetsp:Transcript_128882/g.412010  ORF Transcript_128882/g.412010 Transcript_128882/m.412010 type:complete len:178 (+) Transcript_128882:49-582(+)